MKIWLKVLLDAVLLLSVGAILLLGAAIAFFDVRVGPVLSGSMRPAINPGDLVVTAPISTAEIKVGDVISFYPPGANQITIHRVTTVQRSADTWVTTKGDANGAPDEWGEARITDARTWRVTAALPYLGFLAALTSSFRGWLLLGAGLLLGLWVVLMLRPYVPARRRKPQKGVG